MSLLRVENVSRHFGSLIAVKDVSRFEAELLRSMRAEHQDILDDIRDKREISKETGDKLKAAVDKFARAFA